MIQSGLSSLCNFTLPTFSEAFLFFRVGAVGVSCATIDMLKDHNAPVQSLHGLGR
jgi:hypothetical protein